MAYRALTQVLQGAAPAVEPGELIPETFPNQLGEPEPHDFERLVALGAAEKETAKAKKAAKADEPEADAPADEPVEETAEPEA